MPSAYPQHLNLFTLRSAETRSPVFWMGKTHCGQVEISLDRQWRSK